MSFSNSIIVSIGDIWDWHNPNKKQFICIPTNQTVSKQGNAVMGRGIAFQAATKFPKLKKDYGKLLLNNKTMNGFYIFSKYGLITMPVKKHFKDQANIELINGSMENLSLLLDMNNTIKSVAIPMLGCGFGGLLYEKVLPVLLKHWHEKMILVIPPDELYNKEEYRESFLPGIDNRKDKRVSLSGQFPDLEM